MDTNEALWMAGLAIGSLAMAAIVYLLTSIRSSIEAGTTAIISELRDIELTIQHLDTSGAVTDAVSLASEAQLTIIDELRLVSTKLHDINDKMELMGR